jgi:hypothetical protein
MGELAGGGKVSTARRRALLKRQAASRARGYDEGPSDTNVPGRFERRLDMLQLRV